MKNDLSPEEVEYVKNGLFTGATSDFLAHVVIMRRERGLYNDIRAQIRIIKEGMKDEE